MTTKTQVNSLLTFRVHRVMSSYSFGDNSDQGPPHNGDYSTADVPINSDGTCGGGWVCEHRWHAIGNMAAFRNAVAGTDVNHYDHRGDVVGFARGNKVRKGESGKCKIG